jgi:hypothetical protein
MKDVKKFRSLIYQYSSSCTKRLYSTISNALNSALNAPQTMTVQPSKLLLILDRNHQDWTFSRDIYHTQYYSISFMRASINLCKKYNNKNNIHNHRYMTYICVFIDKSKFFSFLWKKKYMIACRIWIYWKHYHYQR